jgi:hypothetical protein
MITRILLLLFICSVAKAQTNPRTDDTNLRSPDGRPTIGSIPKFDHPPGAQKSVPASNSVPSGNAGQTE